MFLGRTELIISRNLALRMVCREPPAYIWLCAVHSRPPPLPPNGIPLQACRTPYRTPLGPPAMHPGRGVISTVRIGFSRRACTERECHTYTDTWCVCVCVCVRAKGKPILLHGGDRMAIHSQRHGVCVCVYGKRENHPVPQGWGGGGGRVLLPPWPARTVGKPQNRGGGGRGCRRSRGISY